MAINKKSLIYVGAGLATSLVGYFAYDLISTKRQAEKLSNNSSLGSNSPSVGSNKVGSNEQSSGSAQSSNDSYPLEVGMYGAKVWVLQEALNKLGQNISVDGKFGQQTYDAVQNIPFGFGGLNFSCDFAYSCKVSYNNWESIINKAKEKGLNVNNAWTNAKKVWKL